MIALQADMAKEKTSKALVPSYVFLPDRPLPYPEILDFLCERFKNIRREIWKDRIYSGKISDENGNIISIHTPYQPNIRLCYYREVPLEPEIPFKEKIIFQNECLLVACKPHFLPVTPAGPYVNESLLARLIKRTGNKSISPIHRIDRDTAGVVMFTTEKKYRGTYQTLFDTSKVKKKYEAVGGIPRDRDVEEWTIESRIVRGNPFFRMKNEQGIVNAKTIIRCLKKRHDHAYFELEPVTGKKHQLRLHLCRIGSGIMNDRYYPTLQPESKPDFSRPLQLLAKEIQFKDPITGEHMVFISERQLLWEKSES